MSKLFNEAGKCPYCGSEDLDYEGMEPEDDMVYYPWTCAYCGVSGEEWYNLAVIGHSVETEDGCTEEVSEINRKE